MDEQASTDRTDNDLYRALFNETLEGIALHEIICDDAGSPIDYRFLEVNPAFEQITGLPGERIIGRTAREVIPGIEQEWIDRYGHVALTGKPTRFRQEAGPLGQIFEVRAFCPEKGRFATVFFDATDQIRTADALAQSEERYRAVVETSVDGFWICDSQGSIIEVNEAYARMSGFTRDELLRMHVSDLDIVGSSGKTSTHMATVIDGGSEIFDTLHRAKDGTVWAVEITVSYWPIGDGYFFAFLRDVAKRRRAEFLMRARAEMLGLEESCGIDDIFQLALDKAELLTGSSIGFFHLVDPDQEHLTLQSWSTNTLATMCTAEGKDQHYALSEAGIWTECVRTATPTIHNDYPNAPGKKGLPEGHAPVQRELTVPILRAGSVVAIVGVGNKREDYTDADIAPVEAVGSMAVDIALHRTSREQFANFFELVPDMMAIAGQDGTYHAVNPQWEQTLGYSPSDMASTPFMNLVHPEDKATTAEQFARLLEGDTVRCFTNRCRAKDGSYRILQWNAAPSADGSLFFSAARDITESKQREAEMAERESRLQGLLDNAPYGAHMYALEDDGRLIFSGYNAKAEEILGIDHDVLLGKTIEEAFPGLAGTEVAAAYRQVARDGGTWDNEQYTYDADEIAGAFEIYAFSSAPNRMSVFFRDVTELRRAQLALERSEARLRRAVEEAPFPMVIFADDGGILQVNRAWERTTGFAADEIETVAEMTERLYGEHSDLELAEIQSLFNVESPVEQGEHEFHTKFGQDRTWQISSTPLGKLDGARSLMMSTALDVTERNEADIRLSRAMRTLKALSACNEALVRAENEAELLHDVCRIAVQQGGYRMTWVGFAEDDPAKTVRPVAFAGSEGGFLSQAKYSWGDDPTTNGSAGTAIRTKKATVVRSMSADSTFRWHDLALERGFASVAAFPLIGEAEEPFGAIMFVADVEDAYDDDELALLEELAADLAFGIQALRTSTNRLEMEHDLKDSNQRLENMLRQITIALGRAAEARDPYTAGHEERVARIARALAEEIGLPEREVEATEIAGLLHDIGKLSIPAEILSKPGKLSDVEVGLIRGHSQSGHDILSDVDFPMPIAEIVLQHHERMDGSGYPQGLQGEDILMPARILGVADVIEAMASHRPYRPARPVSEAMEQITSHAEKYDRDVVAACIRLYEADRLLPQT